MQYIRKDCTRSGNRALVATLILVPTAFILLFQSMGLPVLNFSESNPDMSTMIVRFALLGFVLVTIMIILFLAISKNRVFRYGTRVSAEILDATVTHDWDYTSGRPNEYHTCTLRYTDPNTGIETKWTTPPLGINVRKIADKNCTVVILGNKRLLTDVVMEKK